MADGFHCASDNNDLWFCGEDIRKMLETGSEVIPYGRQSVNEDDIEAVAQVLRGDWLTTGPTVTAFEEALAR